MITKLSQFVEQKKLNEIKFKIKACENMMRIKQLEKDAIWEIFTLFVSWRICIHANEKCKKKNKPKEKK